MLYKYFLYAMPLLLLYGMAVGQTTLNPDISAIGTFQAYTHDDNSRPQEKKELNIEYPSLELMVSGYVNPYVRADAVIAWHGGEHNAEIEEVYATVLRGLPLNANVRVGKYLLEFGRLNSIHPHAYSFIKRPLPHEVFFGDEGLSDMTFRASLLLPTGSAYTELMGGVLKGDALMGHEHEHEHEGEEAEEEAEADIKIDPGFFGRLATSLAVSEFGELAFGGTVMNGVYEAHSEDEQLRTWLIGGDAKYKCKSNRNRSLQIEGEGIYRMQEQEEGDDLASYGAYGYVDYRFMQKYNAGGIFEYVSEDHAHDHEGEIHVEKVNTWRAGVFVGFMPIEETSLVRLAGHWTDPGEGDSFGEIMLQFVVSLGPHQPHNF